MYKIAGIILLLLVLSSCSNPQNDAELVKDSLSIERIFTAIADTNATVCFSNGEVYLYTSFKDELSPFEDSSGDCFRRIFKVTGIDTSNAVPSAVELSIAEFQTQLKERGYGCFDSLGKYVFMYDSTGPAKPTLQQGEQVDKVKSGSGLLVYTAFNSSKWTTDLYVAMNGASVSVNISGEREQADFFLHDIAGDSVPEICVVRHFLMPSAVLGETPMVRLDIYQLRQK